MEINFSACNKNVYRSAMIRYKSVVTFHFCVNNVVGIFL